MVRFKNRFLALHVQFATDTQTPASPPVVLSNSQLINSIRLSLSQHFGLSASGALGGPLSIKYYSPQTRTILLRCARVGADVVHAACTLLGELGGKSCRVDVVAVSGTIKKLEQWVIKRDRREIQLLKHKSAHKAKRQSKGRKKAAQT